MIYKIISGRYETGTQEQQQGFAQLFGNEKIQFRFDLYFHWYNVIHELGHCLVSSRKVSMNPVQEELYANSFAVAYWKMADANGNLQKLREMITEVLNQIPSPVPPDTDFAAFFQRGRAPPHQNQPAQPTASGTYSRKAWSLQS